MPTPIKYYNSQIKQAYREIESAAADKLLARLPEDLREEYEPIIANAEDDPETYKYVKAADKLSALIKCTEELKLGNKEFLTARDSIKAAIENSILRRQNIYGGIFAGIFAHLGRAVRHRAAPGYLSLR